MASTPPRRGSETLVPIVSGLVVLLCVAYLAITVVIATDTTGAPLTSGQTAATVVFGLSSVVLLLLSLTTAIVVPARAGVARAIAVACAIDTTVHHVGTAIWIGVWYSSLLKAPDGSTGDVLTVPMDVIVGLGGLVISAVPVVIAVAHAGSLAYYARSMRKT